MHRLQHEEVCTTYSSSCNALQSCIHGFTHGQGLNVDYIYLEVKLWKIMDHLLLEPLDVFVGGFLSNSDISFQSVGSASSFSDGWQWFKRENAKVLCPLIRHELIARLFSYQNSPVKQTDDAWLHCWQRHFFKFSRCYLLLLIFALSVKLVTLF